MLAGWFLLALLLAATSAVLAASMRRRPSSGLDRAFERAKHVRQSGLMRRDRLY